MCKDDILAQIKGGLVVSCQARKGWPMYGTEIMVAFAKAAEQGGAVGIRATEPQNVKAIKESVSLPLIGIYKKWYDGFDVYITPTYESASAIIDAGADIVATDGTDRIRPNNETLPELINQIHKNYPNVLIMADCDSVESAIYAEKAGADIVSSTLAGYTEKTKFLKKFDGHLIKQMKEAVSVPVIAEGHILTPEDLILAYKAGADSAVVGTAITRPEILTKNFTKTLSDYHIE